MADDDSAGTAQASNTPQRRCGLRVPETRPTQNGQLFRAARLREKWRPHGDSNPGVHRERVVS